MGSPEPPTFTASGRLRTSKRRLRRAPKRRSAERPAGWPKPHGSSFHFPTPAGDGRSGGRGPDRIGWNRFSDTGGGQAKNDAPRSKTPAEVAAHLTPKVTIGILMICVVSWGFEPARLLSQIKGQMTCTIVGAPDLVMPCSPPNRAPTHHRARARARPNRCPPRCPRDPRDPSARRGAARRP